MKATNLTAEMLIMYEGDDAKLKVTLKVSDGLPVVGRGVKLTIIGKAYTGITNENGVVEFPITLKHGSYPASLVFNGDDEYYASNVVNTSVDVYSTSKQKPC